MAGSRGDFKDKVQHEFPCSRCVKGVDNWYYIQDFPLPDGFDEIRTATAASAWKSAFYLMPAENKNKYII